MAEEENLECWAFEQKKNLGFSERKQGGENEFSAILPWRDVMKSTN